MPKSTKTDQQLIDKLFNASTSEEDTIALKQLLKHQDAVHNMRQAIWHLSDWYQQANAIAATGLANNKTLLQYTHKRYPKRVYRGLSHLQDTVISQFFTQLKEQKKILTVSEHGADATTTSIKKASEFAGYNSPGRTYLVLYATITEEVRPNVLVVPPQYSRSWFNFWYKDVVCDEEYRGEENEVILEGPIPYKLSKTAGYQDAKKWLQNLWE